MIKRSLFVVIACVAVFWSLQCGSDPPTKPHQDREYIAYIHPGAVWDTTGGGHLDSTYSLLRYHFTSGHFDSVRISLPSQLSLVASADGRRLYVGEWEQVLVLDTRTWDTLAVLPYGRTNVYQNGIAVSPDDRYLVLCQNLSGISRLFILRTSDYSVIFADSGAALGTQLDAPYFSPDSRYFYVTSTAAFFLLDLKCRPLQLVDQQISVGQMQSSRDNLTWYYLFGGGIRVYDAVGDSVITAEMFLPGGGDIQLSANERYLFYTNIGSIFSPSYDASIHVMDLTNGFGLSSIPTTNLTDQNGQAHSSWILGSQLILSPDGRKLLVGGNAVGFGWLILDIATMRIEKFYWMQMYNFTCQSAP